MRLSRPKSIAVATIALVVAALVPTSAAAAAEPDSLQQLSPLTESATEGQSESEATVFSVLGDVDVPVGGEVELADFTDAGISEASLEAVGVDVVDGELSADPLTEPAAPAAPEMMPMAAYDIVSSWVGKDNKRINLREAPYIKITTKHNLTTKAVQRVTKSATSILAEGSGTNWNYYLRANQVTCYAWGCYVTAWVNVRVLVDYRPVTGGTYGVVTAYCEGISGACPNYVKNALNV